MLTSSAKRDPLRHDTLRNSFEEFARPFSSSANPQISAAAPIRQALHLKELREAARRREGRMRPAAAGQSRGEAAASDEVPSAAADLHSRRPEIRMCLAF